MENMVPEQASCKGVGLDSDIDDLCRSSETFISSRNCIRVVNSSTTSPRLLVLAVAEGEEGKEDAVVAVVEDTITIAKKQKK